MDCFVENVMQLAIGSDRAWCGGTVVCIAGENAWVCMHEHYTVCVIESSINGGSCLYFQECATANMFRWQEYNIIYNTHAKLYKEYF